MQDKTKTSADVLTIISEPGSLTFATRKEWQELPEICLDELSRHETMLVFMWDADIYFLFHNTTPLDYLKETCVAFRLVRISVDRENAKQQFYTMNLSRAEAAQIMQNRLSLCKTSAERGD